MNNVQPSAYSVRDIFWGALYIVFAAISLTALAAFIPEFREANRENVFRFVTLCSLLAIATYTIIARKGPWSAPTVYQVVFWAFHFGLVSTVGFGLDTSFTDNPVIGPWLTHPTANVAAVLSLMGLIAIGAGAVVAKLVSLIRMADIRLSNPNTHENPRIDLIVAQVGVALILLCTISWFVIILRSGGPALLIGSYSQYLSQTSSVSGLLYWIWFGLGLGLCMVVTTNNRKWMRWAFIPVIILAVFALPLGLRSFLMFPLASAGIVYAKFHKPFSLKTTAILFITSLLIITMVRQVRSVGIGNFATSEMRGSAWDGLAEMGGSLQPVQKVVYWRDMGDEYIRGASYWAPFDRALYYVIPGWPRIPSDEDDRMLNVLVARRAGPIGFSPTAEGFRNFGPMGVVLSMFVIGWIMARIDGLPPDRSRVLNGAAIMIPLLINVRNSFVFVPFYIIAGLVFVNGIMRLIRLTVKRENQPSQGFIPSTYVP